MELKSTTNQTIALAGIAQASVLVQQLATMGNCDQVALETSIGSILKIDSESVVAVYGGLSGLRLGLEQLGDQISGKNPPNPDQARYAASVMFLEKKLSARTELLSKIQTGIMKAQAQSEHFGILHENVFANLGDLYQNTVSTIQPRIMVNGEQSIITRADMANKIRALLLAGIRSALLWRQCGGARWKLIFIRNKIQDELQTLLRQI